jgi:uncharacterized membrane protein
LMNRSKTHLTMVILSAVGLGLSAALTYIHIRVHLDPSYVSLCAVGKTLNCETVAASSYSTVMGLPLSIIGGLFYLFVGIVSGATLLRKQLVIPGIVSLATLAGGAISILLFALSSFVIRALCMLCMATYATNIVLALLACSVARRKEGVFLLLKADLIALWRRPLIVVEIALFTALLIAAGPFRGLPRYWEMASWQSGSRFDHGLDDAGLPWLGAEQPEMTVDEYFDYECPPCRTSHKKLRRILSSHADRLRIIRYDMPRTHCTARSGSCPLTRAAHCAGLEGRYWDWNDAVIASPKPLSGPGRARYEIDLAVKLGFDEAAFVRCMEAPETYQLVSQRQRAGKLKRVTATPTYFLAGQKLTGLQKLLAVFQSCL